MPLALPQCTVFNEMDCAAVSDDDDTALAGEDSMAEAHAAAAEGLTLLCCSTTSIRDMESIRAAMSAAARETHTIMASHWPESLMHLLPSEESTMLAKKYYEHSVASVLKESASGKAITVVIAEWHVRTENNIVGRPILPEYQGILWCSEHFGF